MSTRTADAALRRHFARHADADGALPCAERSRFLADVSVAPPSAPARRAFFEMLSEQPPGDDAVDGSGESGEQSDPAHPTVRAFLRHDPSPPPESPGAPRSPAATSASKVAPCAAVSLSELEATIESLRARSAASQADLRALFDEFDVNHDGVLDKHELVSISAL